VDPESRRESLLKGKFLTQSAPDIYRKFQKPVPEEEKSWDQLMQLAMSVSITGMSLKRKKRIKNTMTSSQLSGSAHRTGAYIPSLLPL
jgi:hypothetical protein